ncbi:ATP-dependent sacrificial sulfur transferase LarE [Lignipirellula cremea]|uniref:tRNA-specific 2-thiouridylase MnmA n=1 Tax=Lignipirellula cremea TaxID=2528010 RepID=A0A518E3B4_9BACT|nr:ATP-dependent sacrificial sulfur transferase LarE [Lignipirellula cremea]QDU98533.1 tRNA-specific 2-thiouridylase MnmA [Lignipirellula cremea]
MSTLEEKREALLSYFRSLNNCVVAFSGGVDSAVAAKAAALALGDQALAVTANSPSLASGELDAARQLAEQIGIRHQVVDTQEFQSPQYVQNAPDRCYHCKTELYTQLEAIRQAIGPAVMVNGANVDDQGDYRPGMQAAAEHQVHSPLAACGFTKADVRALAAAWELPVWDKPASPCLASRIAYGEEVTPERVAMVDAAEQVLRGLGLVELRVRYHKGDMARIEAPAASLPLLAEETTRQALTQQLRQIGFRFVTLDLEGFRSGSLNSLIPVETLYHPQKMRT